MEAVGRHVIAFTTHIEELAEIAIVARLEARAIQAILAAFASKPRRSWAFTPEGYSAQDWYPWRARRRLSLVDRPIIQLDDSQDAHYLVVPGLVRNGTLKVVFDYCHGGGYDAKHFPAGTHALMDRSRRGTTWA